MKTVAELIRWRARVHPERVAVVHGERETTYRALDRASNRVANALASLGVGKGDRVCVLDKGHDRFFEVMFGAAKAGAVFTPVNWRLAPPELAFVIEDAEAPVLFVGGDFAPAVESIRDRLTSVRAIIRFDAGSKAWAEYDTWRDAGAETDPHGDGAEVDTAWQLYTSGTTGQPKGAELTHRNLLATMSIGATEFGLARGNVGLVCMPLYHIGGAGYALCLFYGGKTIVVLREPNPGEILRAMRERRVAHAFLVPALLNFLLQHPDAAKTDFSSLDTILYGASPIPEDLLRAAIDRFGCGFVQAYGLTETTGAVCLLSAEDHLKGGALLRSCGQPTFGCAIHVVDGEGRRCPPGTVGEIVMRGDPVMKGYWNRPEATAEALRGGWFHSGDAGYFDENGYLFIHDRVKDMIVSGGENIYPAEVESVLFSHPEVADVAVIGVPDEKWGESVKAIVVRKSGSEIRPDDLIDYCKDKIAGYKRPRSVDFADALPRNPTGKVLKSVLRDPYWAGKGRRVN